MTFKQQYNSVKASIEMEGFKISGEIETLLLKEAKGEISFEEFTEKLHQKARNHDHFSN